MSNKEPFSEEEGLGSGLFSAWGSLNAQVGLIMIVMVWNTHLNVLYNCKYKYL